MPIEDARGALIYGQTPSFEHWLIAFGVGLVVAQAGFWWFQRTRKGFGDVI
jgi:lipopolysaccharide transport system permease protein